MCKVKPWYITSLDNINWHYPYFCMGSGISGVTLFLCLTLSPALESCSDQATLISESPFHSNYSGWKPWLANGRENTMIHPHLCATYRFPRVSQVFSRYTQHVHTRPFTCASSVIITTLLGRQFFFEGSSAERVIPILPVQHITTSPLLSGNKVHSCHNSFRCVI